MSLNPKRFYRSWLHTEHDPEGPPPDTGRRWRVMRLVVVIAFVVLAGRLWQLQIVQGDRYSRAAAANIIRRLPLEARRGVFYDRNGNQLTTNAPLWEVTILAQRLPKDKGERHAALMRLEERLDLGAVAAVEASDLPLGDLSGLINRAATTLGLSPLVVQEAIEESGESDSVVLLKDDLPVAQMASLRSALGVDDGIEVMLKLEWLVKYSGAPPFEPVTVAEDVPRETALAIEGERLLIPGVSVNQVAARSYTDALLFAHILGYVGKIEAGQIQGLQAQAKGLRQKPYRLDETVGKTGLESVLEGYLRGRAGTQEVEVTSTNRVVRQGKLTEPQPGNNVVLTLDAGLQKAAQESLSRALRASGADSGAVVAIDPRAGQVLSLVSLPSYDNNAFIGGISQADYRRLQENPGDPLLNKATGGLYTPGAALKPFVAAAGLAERVIDRSIEYQCKGRIEIPASSRSFNRDVYEDWNPRNQGPLNVIKALANSCDVYFYIMAGPEDLDDAGQPVGYYQLGEKEPNEFHGIGIERLNRFLLNFGFGKRTGIELPGEAPGLVADPRWKLQQFPGNPWVLSDTLYTAVGKGYNLVTPLQMASATATLANGGRVYKPRLVLKVTNPQGEDVLVTKPEQTGTAGMTLDHLQTVREGMRRSAESGLSSWLRKGGRLPEDVQVAAMPGTPRSAQGTPGIPKVSWFTAFAPYDKPEIAVAVVVSGGEMNDDFAGPVAAEVLKYYFEHK